ncbi:hypothetical protein HRR83_007283 [Exophiala dermatitidis]|nr:hypothetical protein HRR75_006013 [Exophiala dermatitidis]KAJ4511241.1 hypothetical protein HRR73_006574 [Exophiala dermatitidis]KAJ4511823.1 hypothetical protein HRR74_006557 [Exophiala dermatitidis]KAJ4534679.1 hypothetical protein HRR76_006593 [Exophiala dermatitidis]KAJ4545670.1 hypothetical protein HRR78_005944 [Exophiala dermatitidis]
MEDQRPRRNFDPTKSVRYGWKTFDPDKLVKYSPKWEYSRLFHFPYTGAPFVPRMRSVVISVDGGSRGNNRSNPNSRAAYGVFFGRNCRYNKYGLLDSHVPQTSSRAELEAVRMALNIVRGRRRAGQLEGWREIIIKLDSDYVAKCLSEWVWEWERNGYKSNKGKKVEHADLIREIHQTITDLEKEKMAVRFWRVDRQWNQEADALVNQALDDGADSGYED